MTLEDSVAEWPCGCRGLDIRNGPGEHFVLLACPRHEEQGRAQWRDFRGEPFRYGSRVASLCALNDSAALIREGCRLRSVQELLGIRR